MRIFLKRKNSMQQFDESNPFYDIIQDIVSFFEPIAVNIDLKIKLFAEQEERNKALYLKFGWFPFPQIPLSALGFNINAENIDVVMETEIEDALEEIENDIYRLNPEREKILQDAFWAHREGRYTLSIPVFLAQADGIAHEVKSVSAFSRQRGSRLMDKVEKNKEKRFFSDICAELLVENSAEIRANSDKVSQNALNRHGVLHGRSTSYPSKKNSSKAIAFLSGINWLLKARDV